MPYSAGTLAISRTLVAAPLHPAAGGACSPRSPAPPGRGHRSPPPSPAGPGAGPPQGHAPAPRPAGRPIGGAQARAHAPYPSAAGFMGGAAAARPSAGARGMARLPGPLPVLVLPLPVLLLLLPLPVLLLPPPPPSENASLPGCPPRQFQCEPGTPCFPLEWRCDGHPDCDDERDELGCGMLHPPEPSSDGAWVTPPWSSAVLPTGSAEASATPVPGGSVPSSSQGRVWILIIAGIFAMR
ncbi:CD320 antigen isoform X2 [Athene noctua]|uniref:CD320 antigen isoform X2 n=1 Tax=Athene noctua TaxID=126797 RepID=UPI003EC0E008